MHHSHWVAAAGALLALNACSPITVRHEVEPIHVTVDVYLRVERELEQFFAFEDALEDTGQSDETNTPSE
jgi:hypothetical protein